MIGNRADTSKGKNMTTIVREGIEIKANEITYSKPEPLYKLIAAAITARSNCMNHEPTNTEWKSKWEDLLTSIQNNCLPSGAGFDNGTTIDIEASTGEKLVLRTSFHHMNDNGMYDGWTEHTVIVRPSLQFGVSILISGQNRNGIKEYMYDVFDQCLTESTVYNSAMEAKAESHIRTRSNLVVPMELK